MGYYFIVYKESGYDYHLEKSYFSEFIFSETVLSEQDVIVSLTQIMTIDLDKNEPEYQVYVMDADTGELIIKPYSYPTHKIGIRIYVAAEEEAMKVRAERQGIAEERKEAAALLDEQQTEQRERSKLKMLLDKYGLPEDYASGTGRVGCSEQNFPNDHGTQTPSL